MHQDQSPELRSGGVLGEALGRVLDRPGGTPLMDATELVMLTCLRAAVLYPEWAEALTNGNALELDSMAQRLVAGNWRELAGR